MSMLSGVGVLVWGGLLFGFFNGYLESTEFQRGAQLVLGTTSIALLVAVVGAYDSFVRSRLGRVTLGGMGVVSLGMFLGAAIAVFTLERGVTVMLASYILLVAGGTLLGMELLRSGLAPVVEAYVEARTGDMVRLSGTELDLLNRATNDWLACYARCHGAEVDPDVTVREAAELVVETHHIGDTAALLTGVPER
jgi:hypothetical protein